MHACVCDGYSMNRARLQAIRDNATSERSKVACPERGRTVVHLQLVQLLVQPSADLSVVPGDGRVMQRLLLRLFEAAAALQLRTL